MSSCRVLLFYLLLIHFAYIVASQPFDYPTAKLSTLWTNSLSANHSVTFTDGSTVRAILLRGSFGPKFACGFFCNGDCETYLFAIFIVQTNSGSGIVLPNLGFPRVVWSPNRNNPVRINSTLELTGDGDLVLRDADGSKVWSTGTAGKSVGGLNLTEMGNLVLFDEKNGTVWDSFDHPTDVLVPGQMLIEGKNLTASVSSTNWTVGGIYSLSVTWEGLFALFIEADPPLAYFENKVSGNKTSKEPSYAKFLNGSLALFILSSEPNDSDDAISVPPASSLQYMKLESDGHLRVYEWISSSGWTQVADLLTGFLGDCSYPSVCGKYGLCTNGQCGCPAPINGGTTYFSQIDFKQPTLGCSEVTPLSCEAVEDQSFVELEDVTYFTFDWSNRPANPESCKQACLQNCSCKAALFRYGWNSSDGYCYLPSQVFNAKVSDFGLSKLIDRGQNEIVTTLRGTPGYLAPEWLSSFITEKVDVYSFGVVVLETLCGRRNLDRFQPEEAMHLLSVFEKKVKEGELLDLVDKMSEDMQFNGAQAVEMMKVAVWCLQRDFARRPSMSMVVKVLEGVMDVEGELDYNLCSAELPKDIKELAYQHVQPGDATPLLPSVLSGPR
ncbi:EP1-like glycoprotein 2 [Carica papaya]|uniref:EP1-like glycoprotein 2 n=1 Tax=Carica papaya TaxID=3649 RepID=UPI000B8C72C3|nr:EP1-like glycoprotein 2 [Carica papaya]